jgi:hypothetical protein
VNCHNFYSFSIHGKPEQSLFSLFRTYALTGITKYGVLVSGIQTGFSMIFSDRHLSYVDYQKLETTIFRYCI